ncbi:MAG: CocE/NonD family hydrolase [Solirubrobacterales bacterium]|nr:CocE/NonD family hydrolase [Solirubrobacterales bacterium]
MSLASEIFARRMRLPRAQTRHVVCEPDLRASMDDRAVLLADRWVARAARGRRQPTVLVRSPYGRRQMIGLMFGRLLAERGLQVVIQSVRGTFGSEGTFSPFDERDDGLATLRWIEQQPWHGGPIGMIGPSYLGLVQWAVGADAGAQLGGLTIQFSASQFHAQTYAGGSLSLETAASWLVIVAEQERRAAPIAIARTLHRLPRLLSELPLADLDELTTGGRIDWYRDSMAHPRRDDSFWEVRDYTAGVTEVRAPVQLIGGWYDIFLPWMLEDFCALQAAGLRVHLIIGPWTHTGPDGMSAGIREGLGWLRAQLLGDGRLARSAAIRVRVTGERAGGGWRELPSWPPPGTSEYRLWLGGGARLEEHPPRGVPAAGDRYRYDPSDPTPSLGGPVLLAREPVVDNRPLEARADVLTYTAPALQAPLEAIGPVRVELFVRAGAPFFDIFARVCDVDEHGASWNVCDALARVTEDGFERLGDGSWRVAFDLWPMGHHFAAGHSIRLQVSSGAHPRYARNPGTGEDPMTATALRAVAIEILHDQAHPSQLILPRSGDR